MSDKWQRLQQYWNELPQVKEFEKETFKKVSQKIRYNIINTLQTGINTDGVRRRVLNAQEIKKEVEEKTGEKLEKGNLYFHLAELERLGAILIVDTIPPKGKKRAVAYYGRTAKMFFLKPSSEWKEYPIAHSSEFFNLIKKLNPKKTEQELEDELSKINQLNNQQYSKIIQWFEENEDLIYNLNLNPPELFEFLDFIRKLNYELIDGLHDIAKLLKFDV